MGWIEFLEYTIQGFEIMFNFVLKIILSIVYLIKFIFLKIFRAPKWFSEIKMKNKQKNIDIDEFNDLEDWKMKEEKEQQRLEHEYTVLENTFMESLIDMNNNGTVIDEVFELNSNMKKAKKNLYNFKFLDSVTVKKNKTLEATKEQEIKEIYKNFDIELFKNWAMQIFKLIKLGNSEELEIIKKVITQPLYNSFLEQMKRFEKDGLQYVTEDLLIRDVSLYDYSKGLSKEEIKILIHARMKEYIKDKRTGNIIRGNAKKGYEKKIFMTFFKQNADGKEGFITNCPNCGAATTKTEFGKCQYCGTLVFPIRYNWTLIKFETL